MPVLEKSVQLRCEQCGTVLEYADLGCLSCLLGGGLSEPAGRRFQHYELCLREDETLDELGRGAMGITYRARDLNLDSLVALKIISAHFSDKASARERFRHEARAAAQLRHPNVASVFHFGETEGGECFYVMELVEGETLEARVRRSGPLTVSETLAVAEQVSRALVAAEDRGLVHRDLKPSNLMLVSNESSEIDASLVKVIDFGLAQAVVALQENPVRPSFSGTPEFASPEQFDSSKPLDARSDIYALGVTLWYLLCGRSPFLGQLEGANERRLPLEQLTKAKVPAPLVALLRSMLANDPSRRPQTAKHLLSAVRTCHAIIQRKRRGILSAFAGCALVLLIAGGFWLREIQLQREFARETATPSLPGRSIAVLPFENLSEEKEHALFADGVQDDILTKLAKIADLKVISRTSVMQYRGKQDVRQIGNTLRVSHVLEGTVRRFGDKVHVNAQLVDARTDQNIWADEYDRNLNDFFAIETEVAQSIANRLKASLTPREQAALRERPTKDLVAYDLYIRALPLIEAPPDRLDDEKFSKAVDLLNQAIARDPNFLLAYCLLAQSHDWLSMNADHTPARLALAKSAIDSAFRLNPNSGEAHLALAVHFYHGYFDYEHARAELAIAQHTLPNNPQVYEMSSWINRRQGRWADAVRDMEHASDLDPRSFYLAADMAALRFDSRPMPFEKTREALDRMLAIKPDFIDAQIDRGGGLEMHWRGDTRHWRETIKKILAENPAAAEDKDMKAQRYQLALYDRDFDAASRAAAALPQEENDDPGRDFVLGGLARAKGDAEAARAAFTAARTKQEAVIQKQSKDPRVLAPGISFLGLIDAGLGRKEEALREGRHAVALMPRAEDATVGPGLEGNLALIYAWTGERDLAIEQLALVSQRPGGPTYGELRLDPQWDDLRGDPRFERIAAGLAPAK